MRARDALRTAASAVVVLAIAEPALAGDPFEIQVYDGTANRPGVPGLELHLNDWASGRRDADTPEIPLHGQFHATLEPSLGVLPFWEIGAYWQMALRDDGGVDWAGAKLRSKFVTPPGYYGSWRLGVNLEASYLPETYDRARWGSEIRPIVAWQDARWLVAFNPIVDQSFGPGGDQGPSFEPALKVSRTLFDVVALGFEYYATIGPLAAPLPLRDQDHVVYEVVDLVSIDRLELNVGVGEGLTPASAGVVAKAILGYTFDRVVDSAPLRASRSRAPQAQ